MIYVASPYFHESYDVRFHRYTAVLKYTNGLIRANRPAFSPIVYGYFFEHFCGANANFESWMEFNDEVLKRCDQMHILMLEGWDVSRGILHETDVAKQNGLPITYIEPKI